MNVALIQAAFDTHAVASARVEHVLSLMDTARGADLVVLPELWHVGYFDFDRYESGAEPLLGPTVRAMCDAAVELGAYVHAGSIVERGEDGRLYNTSVLIAPTGRLVHTYRKVHLFGYESEEARLLTPGVEVRCVPTDLGVLAMTTCYDLRFPELYRLLTDAEICLVTSAWPTPREEHWRLLTRARAVENLFYVIACNAAGAPFAGRSVVVDPWGEVLAEADVGEEVLLAAVDVASVAKVRTEFPVLDDKRIDIGGR